MSGWGRGPGLQHRVAVDCVAPRCVAIGGVLVLLCNCSSSAVDVVLRCSAASERAECASSTGPAQADEAPPSDVWPNAVSAANSDPWLVQHHDGLVQLRPRLLVLNFHNPLPGDALLPSIQLEMDALAEGSRYHGYSDPAAPPFLRYQLERVVDLTDAVVPEGWPYLSSTLLPVDELGEFLPEALFSTEFAQRMGIADPAAPGVSLDLCAIFERGIAHEVWLAVGDGMREPPLMLERKQRYDPSLAALPGEFQPCIAASGHCLQVSCGVTVRLAHLNPRRGPGCDLQVRGWSLLEGGRSIPYLAANADPFFNADFATRFAAPFNNLYEACTQGAEPCLAYPAPTALETVGRGATGLRIEPYLQGCGSPDFPPNATARWAWASAQAVDARCEHYQLLDGGESRDRYLPYSVASLPSYDARFLGNAPFPGDCGGAWQLYWRQNIPGLHNPALAVDGTPMKNWWPFTFY